MRITVQRGVEYGHPTPWFLGFSGLHFQDEVPELMQGGLEAAGPIPVVCTVSTSVPRITASPCPLKSVRSSILWAAIPPLDPDSMD